MKTLDRYLLGEMVVPFAFGVGAFSSILFASGKLFQLLDLLTRQGYSLAEIGELFVLYLPEILRVTFPMSVLLACLLGITRLAADSEITALLAGGMSLHRLLRPLLAFALLVAGGTFLFNETVVPKGEQAARRIIAAHPGAGEPGAVLLRHPSQGQPDRIIYAGDFDPRSGTLRDVDVFAYAESKARVHIYSREARWMGQLWQFRHGYQETLGFPELERQDTQGAAKGEGPPGASAAMRQSPQSGTWGSSIQSAERPKVGRILETFEEMEVYLGKSPGDIERERKEPEEMTASELAQQLGLLQRLEARLEETVNVASLKVNLQMHYSVPLASVVFCLVGVPLGLRRQRSGSSTGLGLSIIVIFAYYVLLRYCGALAKNGQLSPVIGAWLANVVTGATGLALLARSPK